jgi:XTP/dITP diphosphohydrolase
VAAPDNSDLGERRRRRILIASSNQGKLRDYQELASGSDSPQLELLPNFRELPPFDESAPTFAENSVGKALHYSQFTSEIVLAEDSGLVVDALGGAPGVHSARYAGPNATDADRNRKLLDAMGGKRGEDRGARFVCVTTLAGQGRAIAIFSDFAQGLIIEQPRGVGGFGYDPVFLLPALGRTFAQLSAQEKNEYSHRGRTFRKVLQFFCGQNNTILP